MAKKTYRARPVNMPVPLETAMDRTHYVFVECLRQMIDRYIAMRKGKHGELCQQLVKIMLSRSNTFAHGVMDKLTRPVWKESEAKGEWVTIAKSRHESEGPMFLQHEGFASVDGLTIHTKPQGKCEPKRGRLAVPAKFWHQVCDSASAFLKSNQELMEGWRQDRKKWLAEKAEWEEKDAKFLQFWNGPYRLFEETCEQQRIESQIAAGQKAIQKKGESRQRGKRISRWQLWYEWIISNPEVIEWRGKASASDFKAVPIEVQAEIKRKNRRQDKVVSGFLDWLKENNPELKALDRLRRFYVSNYARFKRPPTLTLPSPWKHPYWMTFEKREFYRDADLEKGTVRLRLIDEKADGSLCFEWFDVQIKCDPRLLPSKRAKAFAREGRYPPYIDGKVGNTLNQPAKTAQDRKAGVAGGKLIVKRGRKDLLFTVIEQNMPRQVKWQKTKQRRCSADNAFSPDGERVPLKVLAIDLGIRHVGAYALAKGQLNGDAWHVKWLKKGVLKPPAVPNLRSMRQHDRQLRKNRGKQGKVAKGERTFIELQEHRTKMAQDRFKKGANAIIELAREHDVQLVLFENLKSLRFSAFDERWVNRQLRDMNRRKIVDMTAEQCKEFGIECKDDISPWLTSHMCSRCFRPGWRFSMKKKNPFREGLSRSQCQEYGYPIWDKGGHLFRCPHCGYSANSDVNAAGNLAAKFFGLWSGRGISRKDWVYTCQEGSDMTFNAKETFEEWAGHVQQSGRLGPDPF